MELALAAGAAYLSFVAALFRWLRPRVREQLKDEADRARYAAELREDRFLPGIGGGRYGQ